MGVLIEEKEQVDELQKWFSGLWNESEPVNTQDLEKYVSSIKSSPAYDEMEKTKNQLKSKPSSINAKLIDIANNKPHKRLIEIIKNLSSDREWINDYFDLAKEIIEFTGLTSNDLRSWKIYYWIDYES